MKPVRKIVDKSVGVAPATYQAPTSATAVNTAANDGVSSVVEKSDHHQLLVDNDVDVLGQLAKVQREMDEKRYKEAANQSVGAGPGSGGPGSIGLSPFSGDFLAFGTKPGEKKLDAIPDDADDDDAGETSTKRRRLNEAGQATVTAKAAPRSMQMSRKKAKGKTASSSFRPLTGLGDSDSDDSALAFVIGEKEDEESEEGDEDFSSSENEAAVEHSDVEEGQTGGDGDAAGNQGGFRGSNPSVGTTHDQQKDSHQARQKLKSTVFERFHSYGFGVHTLVSLGNENSFTFQGPCVLISVVQDTLADGFSLRSAPLVLPDYHHRVCCLPTKRRGKRPDLTGLSSGSVAAEELANQGTTVEEAMLGGKAGVETVEKTGFGKIDWHWVHKKIQDWKTRLGTVPPTLLVLEPASSYERFEESAVTGAKVGTGIVHLNPDDAPKCFAKYRAEVMEQGVFTNALPQIGANQATSVAAVGCSNVGKSTQLRFTSNFLLSASSSPNPAVLWADFDVGQPEFGLSGSMCLHKVTKFLFSRSCMTTDGGYKHAVGNGLSVRPSSDAEPLLVVPLGGLQPRLKCPVIASNAIAYFCDEIEKVRSQPGYERVPLVINTHGWVLSTGRRATLEILRRLKPHHIVHLLTPQEEPWLTPELIADPKQGLNLLCTSRRFNLVDSGAPRLAPVEKTNTRSDTKKQKKGGDDTIESSPRSRPSSDLVSIHQVTVRRKLIRKKAAAMRELTLLAHLGLNLDGTLSLSSMDDDPTTGLEARIVEFDLSKICLGEVQEGEGEVHSTSVSSSLSHPGINARARILGNAVVCLASASSTLISGPDEHHLSNRIMRLEQLFSNLNGPERTFPNHPKEDPSSSSPRFTCLGVGVILSSEAEILQHPNRVKLLLGGGERPAAGQQDLLLSRIGECNLIIPTPEKRLFRVTAESSGTSN